MPLAIRPSLIKDVRSAMCTMILIRAVYMKARQALMSLHKY